MGEERTKRTLPVAWLFFAAAAVSTLFFYRDFVFHADRLLYGSDMLLEGYPLRQFAIDEIRAGRGIPLWTPHIYGGMPYVALLPGPLFYPSSLLYLLLPLYRAVGWTFVLHTFLAAPLGYFLGRSFRLRPGAAMVCGTSFMLTGYVTSHLYGGQDGRMFAMTLIPLALGMLERGLRTGEPRWFCGLAATVGLQIFTPHTQVTYFSALALGLYLLFHVAARGRPPRGSAGAERGSGGAAAWARPVLLFAAAFVAGGALGAIQLLPTLELLPHVTRAATESGYAFAASWALPPQELSALVLPDLIGSLETYWGSNPIKLHTEYLGTATVAMALLGLVASRRLSGEDRRVVGFLGGASALGILFALGAATPIHRIAWAVLPMIDTLRAPAMMMAPVAVFTCLLAGFGWEAALAAREEEGGRRWLASRGALAALAAPFLLLGLAAALAPGGLQGWVASSWYPAGWPRQPSPELTDRLRVGGWMLLVGFGLSWGLAHAVARRRLGGVAVVALLVFSAFDLGRVDARYRRVEPAAPFLSSDPIIETLREEASPGERIWALQAEQPGYRENQFMYWGLSSATGNQKFILRDYARLVGGIQADAGLMRYGAALVPLLDVRYLISRSEQTGAVFEPLVEDGGRRLYRIRTGVPHAYFPAEVEVVADTAAAVRSVRETVRPLERAVIERGEGSPSGPVADPGHTPGAGRGTATILRYEPDVVEFGIDAERAGLLVASEIFAPGWRAFVDGGERAIWRANGAFRGVEIPAGRHRLRFEYRAPGYAAGRALSVTAAVGLLAAFLLAGIRRRRAGVSVSG